MAKQKKERDKFEALEQEFKDSVNSATEDEVRKVISTTALNHASLMASQIDDQDWQEAKARYQEANSVYSESNKVTKLKIVYCREILQARGVKV